MNRDLSTMRETAARLIADELSRNQPSARKTSGAFMVCGKLRAYLVTLMGNEGFHSLLARALALAAEDVLWLGTVGIRPDGELEGLEQPAERIDANDDAEGAVMLVAHLLALLAAFIGEGLTLRIVGEVWPDLILPEVGFAKGDKNEKTK